MSRPTREELQPYSEYISSFGEPNLVIDVYKNRRGRWNMVRIFVRMIWAFAAEKTCL